MRTVYKYNITQNQTFVAFKDYIPRHVGIDNEGELCVWLEVETNNKQTIVEVKVVGTGQEIDFAIEYKSASHQQPFGDWFRDFRFAGTAIRGNGLVWHVYLR